jgi:hypothetical protein
MKNVLQKWNAAAVDIFWITLLTFMENMLPFMSMGFVSMKDYVFPLYVFYL